MSRKSSGSSRGSSTQPLPDNVVSLAERRRPAGTPSEQYGALVPPFAGWLVENAVCPPNRVEQIVVSVANAVDALSRASKGFAATHWRSRDVDHLLERVLTSDLVEGDDETRAHIAGDVIAFLQFLEATNRWTGTDEDLGYGLPTLVSYIESMLASLPPAEVDEPPIAPEVERAALTALPVVARLDALLGWIGERRPVTATGALKRALVMEAFDAVGGKRADLAPRKVQSMWDLPVLEQTWVVAAMVDLISIGKTVVKPGPAAPVWRDPDRNPDEYLPLCRDAVTHSLIVALGRRGEGRLEAFHSALDEATAAVLSAGLGEHPLPSAPAERLHALSVLFPGMPAEPSFLGSMLVDRLDDLVADGLLDDADGYRVPTPLRPAVRAAVRILLGDATPVAIHPPARCTLRISLRSGWDCGRVSASTRSGSTATTPTSSCAPYSDSVAVERLAGESRIIIRARSSSPLSAVHLRQPWVATRKPGFGATRGTPCRADPRPPGESTGRPTAACRRHDAAVRHSAVRVRGRLRT